MKQNSKMNLTLTSIGLIFDGVGAVVLGWAYAATSNSNMLQLPEWNIDAPGDRMSCERRWDARVGVGALFSGFLLQFIASLGYALPVRVDYLLLFSGVLILFLYLCFRSLLVDHDIRKITLLHQQKMAAQTRSPQSPDIPEGT